MLGRTNNLPTYLPNRRGLLITLFLVLVAVEVATVTAVVMSQRVRTDKALALHTQQLLHARVAGKGLSAAILMSSAHASLRALCQAELPPHETIGRLNELLEQRFPYNRFVTLWYALLDPAAHALTYVNACQEHPLVRRSDGRWHRLDKSGPPVGMLPASRYQASTVALAPGDVVLVYSDGVIDCRNSADEAFGEERLLDLVTAVGDRHPAEIEESILGAVDEHRGTVPHADDVTLLLLKRLV